MYISWIHPWSSQTQFPLNRLFPWRLLGVFRDTILSLGKTVLLVHGHYKKPSESLQLNTGELARLFLRDILKHSKPSEMITIRITCVLIVVCLSVRVTTIPSTTKMFIWAVDFISAIHFCRKSWSHIYAINAMETTVCFLGGRQQQWTMLTSGSNAWLPFQGSLHAFVYTLE